MRSLLIFTLSTGLLLGAVSCDRAAAEAPPDPQAVSVAPTLPPIRIAMFIDETLSMNEAAVARVTPESLTPVLDRLSRSGGELAIGFIRDRSDAALLRLVIDEPPAPPVLKPLPKNLFAAARTKAENDDTLARYEADRRAWQSNATTRSRAFGEAIAPFLLRDQDAPRTDIRSAVVRADVFLSEPVHFMRPPQTIIVFVSDGVDTLANGNPPRLNSSAEVLVVNGVGSIGYLAPYQPKRFESVDAAFRYAAEGGARARR